MKLIIQVGNVNYNFPGEKSLHTMVLSKISRQSMPPFSKEFVFKNTYVRFGMKTSYSIRVGKITS